MPIDPTAVHRHLTRLLQQRSLDAALEFFDALSYRYVDELPLPTRTWPEGIRHLVQANAEPPLYLAAHRGFRVIYTHLTTKHLARTVKRPIVEQTLGKLHPYALFLFANRDLSEWDFVNVKYLAEEDTETGAEGWRRTIRRIHVGQAERLHTLDGQRDYLYRRFKACCEADPAGTNFYTDALLPLFVALSTVFHLAVGLDGGICGVGPGDVRTSHRPDEFVPGVPILTGDQMLAASQHVQTFW